MGRLSQRKSRQGEATQFVYDGLKLIQERHANGSASSYIYADGLEKPVLMVTGEQVYLFVYDRLGSVIALVDITSKSNSDAEKDTNKVLARYRYDAWGNVLEETATVNQPFRFAGYIWEPDAALYYLGARWYDASIGRFLSPDPVLSTSLNPQDWNAYAYASNDPVNRIDAAGLRSQLSLARGYSTWNALVEPLNRLPRTLVENFRNRLRRASETNLATELRLGREDSLIEIAPTQTDSLIEGWGTSDPETANVLFSSLLGSLPDTRSGFNLDRTLSLLGLSKPSKHFGNVLVNTTQLALPEVFGKVWYDGLFTSNANSAESLEDLERTTSELESSLGYTDDISVIPSLYSQKNFKHPGGIPFEQSAQALAQLSEIQGAVWDDKTNQLIILGSATSAPKLQLNDLLVAIEALYSGQEIGVSIDPVPSEQDGQKPANYMTVRYVPEQTKGTNLGRVLFEADRQLKVLSMGEDFVKGEPAPTIEGYQSILDRLRPEDSKNAEAAKFVWSRMWFQPEPLSIKVAPGIFKYNQVNLKLQTEHFDPGPPPQSGGISDPIAQSFVDHLNQNYNDYAAQIPAFKELEQATRLVSIAKWLRNQSVPIDLAWLHDRRVSIVETPLQTPAQELFSPRLTLGEDGTSWYQQGIYGGVTLAPEPTQTNDPSLSPTEVLDSRPSNSVVSWKTVSGEIAVAVSINTTPEVGGVQRAAVDLDITGRKYPFLGLVRYFDSQRPGYGTFGQGWSETPYELEFPEPKRIQEDQKNWYQEIHFRDRPMGSSTTFRLVSHLSDQSLHYESADSKEFITLKPTTNGYSVQKGDQKIEFNSDGQLQKIALSDGTEASYTWEEVGGGNRLSQIRHLDNRAILLSYDSPSSFRATAAKDHTGRTVHYEYNNREQLTSVKDSQQQVRATYAYQDRRLTQVQDANGEATFKAEFNEQGQAMSLALQNVSFKLESDGKIQIQRDGQVVGTVSYDDIGRVSRVEGPQGLIWSIDRGNGGISHLKTADPSMSLDFRIDQQGYIDQLRHPEEGTLAEFARDPNNHRPLSITNLLNGTTTNMEYDQENRLHRMTIAYKGHSIEASFNADGHLISLEDPDGIILNLNQEDTIWTNAVQVDNNAAATIKRDALGRPIEIATPSGEIMKLEWNAYDQLVNLEVVLKM